MVHLFLIVIIPESLILYMFVPLSSQVAANCIGFGAI